MFRWTIAMAVATLVGAACGSDGEAKRSREAAIAHALEAAQAGDVGAFDAVMVSVDDIERLCPSVVEKVGRDPIAAEVTEARKGLAKAMERCAALDWTNAKQVRVEGGELGEERPHCDGVRSVEDLRVYFAVEGGEIEVKLDDPLAAEGYFAFGDKLRCRRIEPAPARE